MMETKFLPSRLMGEVRLPSSKSVAHRALITAALAGSSTVRNVDLSNDITETANALSALCADIGYDPESRIFTTGEPLTDICKKNRASDVIEVDCGESASTLRFMIPIAAALGRSVIFKGHGRLPKRTTEPYVKALSELGVEMSYPENGDFLPLRVSGKMCPGEARIRGDVSSQFVTGMIYAFVITGEKGLLTLTTPLESKPYVDMTTDILTENGAVIEAPSGLSLPEYRIGRGKLRPFDMTVEGDCSQAAFFAVGAAVNGHVTMTGINMDTTQGDFELFHILERFGANVEYGKDSVTVSQGILNATDIDAADIPDLVPALAVLAGYAHGDTKIYNAERLRLKESDRIKSTIDMLNAIGVSARETEDGMIITGGKPVNGGFVNAQGDHRIAMSAAAASAGVRNSVTVDDMSCIAKSYPNFLDDFASFGGQFRVTEK